jgi:hypothetical protein
MTGEALAVFAGRFATEEACRAYLVRLQWPDGFQCPGGGGAKTWPVRSRLEGRRGDRPPGYTGPAEKQILVGKRKSGGAGEVDWL